MLKTFPSKILLFGEYTLMQGSNALAIPFPQFSGKFNFLTDSNPEKIDSNQKLLEVLEKLKRSVNEALIKKFNLRLFEKELKNGLYFNSNIPLNYGLGSSGALTAALYDKYVVEKALIPELLKEELAQLESVFHGKSSGIDPLVSFYNKAILYSNDKITSIEKSLKQAGLTFLLIDSNLSRDTKTHVAAFLEKNKKQDFSKQTQEQLVPCVNKCIQLLLEGNESRFLPAFKELSMLQLSFFSEMIPEKIKNQWLEGLANNKFYLKLCGAGGGGYYLACCKNENIPEVYNAIILW